MLVLPLLLKGIYFTFKKTFAHFIVYSGFWEHPGQFLSCLIQYLDIWYSFYQTRPPPIQTIITSNSILTVINSMKTPFLFSGDSCLIKWIYLNTESSNSKTVPGVPKSLIRRWNDQKFFWKCDIPLRTLCSREMRGNSARRKDWCTETDRNRIMCFGVSQFSAAHY